ncbi:hypothetical protein V1290_005550 [Bradyrhizobium sp. AZCC 1578]
MANSYQWDIVFEDGNFYKKGIGGLGLYISPSCDMVLAWFCTGKNSEVTMARSGAFAK